MTPIFYVECLADLERNMVRMKSSPEQLVGSLAEHTGRAIDRQCTPHADFAGGTVR